MRMIDLLHESQPLMTPSILELTNVLHEYKGRYFKFAPTHKDVLDHLLKQAIIQSTISSNRLEGIVTAEARGEAVLSGKLASQNRGENELLGYQKVLKKIHRHYHSLVLTPELILDLHREMYAFEPVDHAGTYKTEDNLIQEIDEFGKKRTRFVPLNHFETPIALNLLCGSYRDAVRKNPSRALILIPLFILDFLCIHPFEDGNGRMSRLLTLLLLYQAGFDVGRYISIERTIEETKASYYQTLQVSSLLWHEEKNDVLPFIQYLLSVILGCYRDFEQRILAFESQENKATRIRLFFDHHVGSASKKEIQEFCPDISVTTIEAVLAKMVKEGFLEKIGGGRFTTYRRRS